MSRLSNATRETMAAALVRHRFKTEGEALVGESQELFRKFYDAHYDTETRKNMTAILKKHSGAFKSDTDMTANVVGRRIEVGQRRIGDGYVNWDCVVAARPFLQDQSYQGTGMAADDPLAVRMVAFDDARQALVDQLDGARREALGALQQFTTGKKLAAEWPEAMPIIGDLIPEDDRTLPVIQVAGLNLKFGLPPKD